MDETENGVLNALRGWGGSTSMRPSSKKKDDKWNELSKVLQEIPPSPENNIDELVLKLYAIFKSNPNEIADAYIKLTTLIMMDTESTDFDLSCNNEYCKIIVRGTTRKNRRRLR